MTRSGLSVLAAGGEPQLFLVQRRTVYDLLIRCHLLPDIQLGIGEDAVLRGNILHSVIPLHKAAAIIEHIAAGGEMAAVIDPCVPPVGFKVEVWSEDVISLNKKISDILSQVQFLTQLQQAGGVDPDTFISSNNKLNEQLRRLKQEKARLLDTDSDDLADRTRDLMDVLEDGPDFLDRFDAELFDALVEKIIVDSNERLRFRLKNGLELTEQIERTKR